MQAQPHAAVPPLTIPPGFATHLPTFRPIARKLLAIIGEERTTLKTISELIRADAAFSGDVLRFANSTIFSTRHEVASVLHAVSMLGMDRIRAMILTLGMRDMLAGHRSNSIVRACWRHNLACALAAESLSEIWWLDKAACYTAGLMHDIGRLALLVENPRLYAELLIRSSEQDEPLADLERQSFGLDSHEAGLWIWDHWNLPPSLRKSARSHHALHTVDADSLESLVSFSCSIADQSGFSITKFTDRLPPKYTAKIEPLLTALKEIIPYKVNSFELDFLK